MIRRCPRRCWPPSSLRQPGARSPYPAPADRAAGRSCGAWATDDAHLRPSRLRQDNPGQRLDPTPRAAPNCAARRVAVVGRRRQRPHPPPDALGRRAARRRPSLGSNALDLQNGAPPPAVEATLTALINDVVRTSGQTVLVLDDYHVLDAPPVHEAVTFLLDHLPPQLHLMLTSRADPPLPLARLRTRGELAELRAAHLRFTPAEAENLLNPGDGTRPLRLRRRGARDPHRGWVAGLQLAVLSMCDRDDVTTFIGAFTGSNRFVIDYLVDEVLQRQPGHTCRNVDGRAGTCRGNGDRRWRQKTASPDAPSATGRPPTTTPRGDSEPSSWISNAATAPLPLRSR